MQIHELTNKQLTEASIADTIKSAGSAVKRGVGSIGQKIAQSDLVQQNITPLAQTVQQGKVASPTAYAANKQAAVQAMGAKYAQKLQAQGYGTAATGPKAPPPPAPQQSVILGPNGKPLPSPATPPPPPRQAGAVNTNRLQAQPVGTTAAPAVMLPADFNALLNQMHLTTNHITTLKDRVAQDPAFAAALLKSLGLKK